jgi:hypothetical protein
LFVIRYCDYTHSTFLSYHRATTLQPYCFLKIYLFLCSVLHAPLQNLTLASEVLWQKLSPIAPLTSLFAAAAAPAADVAAAVHQTG